MRILLVTMKMDIGGAETHILELAKELKRRKNDVFVVSNGGKYVEELEAFGIEHINAPLHDRKIADMMKSYKILKQVIAEKQIDIVHSHSRISSFVCGKLFKKMKFPFVTSAHGCFKVTTLLKLMTNWGENVVAVSDDIKKYLIDNYALSEENIFVTVNGIDTEKFKKDIDFSPIEKEFNLNSKANRIVHISRLDDSCTLVTKKLVEIAENLDKKIENLEIVIVGSGNAYEEIAKQAEQVNEKVGKELIILTGARTDVNNFVASGTIFVGVSRAALEAMSCEQPVIIAGTEGYLGVFGESRLNDAVETNFCCRGLGKVSDEVLEADILELINADNKEKQGKYNREVVKKYYSIAKMTDDCEKAYNKTLKEHRR